MGIDVTQWRIEIARYWKFSGRRRHGRGKSPGAKAASGTSCSPLLALLLSFCLITAPSLLLQAGDVERNPGPPKIQNQDILTPGDLPKVFRELNAVSNKWFALGVSLNANGFTLDAAHHSTPSDCLREMLNHWLKQVDPQPCWSAIVAALRSPTMNEPQLAQTLDIKYCRGTTGGHSLTLGTPTSEDVVLYQEQSRKDSRYLGTVSHTFSYQCQEGEEITAVLAKDLLDDDTGGTPQLVSGGVGEQHVSIRITSEIHHGFHFQFIVYGKRTTGRHSLTLGTLTSEDVVLYKEQSHKGRRYLGTVSHTFLYQCQMGEEITAVLVEDLLDDDTGGYPQLVSGGVGEQHVSIKITSQQGCGFHFEFSVYGKRQAQVESRTADTQPASFIGGRSSGGDSSFEDKKLLEEAMKEGYISASFLKVIFTGAGGVGKTHTLSLIRGVPPPSSRESTDCANKAVTLRVDAANDEKWEEIDVDKRKEIIAGGICAAKEKKQLEPIPEPQEEKTQMQPEPKSKSQRTVQQQPHSEADPKLSTPVSSQPLETELDLMKIINELKSGEVGGKLLELKWVYAVDTGGQPPFHELLSAFIKGASVCAFVVKLSETLAHRPQVEYWVDGTRVGHPFPHPLSNLQILEQSIQTIQALPSISNDSESSKRPLLLVIGTHRDEQTNCEETLEEKQKILCDVINQPGFDFRFNTHNGAQGIIFDVNALKPEQEDKEKASTLRGVIASKMPRPENIPLRHYCLELELERLATTEPVITMTKCKQIGRRLNFDDTGLKAALRFLHRLNVLLYYPECKEVEELIFCDPLVLIKVVSKVVKLIHMGETKLWKDSGESGLITVEQLNCTEFDYCFQSKIFTPNRLFKLFEHLLIVAKVEEKNAEYFMPCLLDELEITDLERKRPNCSPLVFQFRDEKRRFIYAPSGLFSALVAFLLSLKEPDSKLCSLMMAPNSGPRYRNMIEFCSDSVDFTLMNFHTSFEVFASCQPNYLPEIRNIILKGLEHAKEVRNFEHVNYKETFPCSNSQTATPGSSSEHLPGTTQAPQVAALPELPTKDKTRQRGEHKKRAKKSKRWRRKGERGGRRKKGEQGVGEESEEEERRDEGGEEKPPPSKKPKIEVFTDADGPRSDPTTFNLYSQMYEQIVGQALAGLGKKFQLLNPMQDWTWAPATAGFIDPQTYRFVGQSPTWSTVGTYEPGGSDMHQAYLSVLTMCNVIGDGTNEHQLRDAREEVTRARNYLLQNYQQADVSYAQYRRTVPTDTPVESYDTWMAKFWNSLEADKLSLDKAVETYKLVIDQKNAGLKDAIDAAAVPKDHTDSKPGFLKVQIGTTIGVRPAYTFLDPKVWLNRVIKEGGNSLMITLSASVSSSSISQSWAGESTCLDGGFFSTYGCGGWQSMDLAEDKKLEVKITIEAFSMLEVGPDTSWYNSALLKKLAKEDNWNPPFSTKGGDGKKPVFGKGGMLPLILTGIVVGFQPSIEIKMSNAATYKKYKERWEASSALRIGPFQIGGSGDKTWLKSADNKELKFRVESKASYPFIMGITVANPGE